ncbi:MAG: phenylacetic acid degradation b [Cyclobacteriaceae bacterium]|nr:phenylacetic acid degradation b [Cyclobacteriaceae bacterium]
MESLDPRVKRLPSVGQEGQPQPKAPLDQLGTFEVFVQPREGKPFQHEGIVHASDRELAFVLAKEAFTRRFQCVALAVADTRHVYVSPMTEGQTSVWEVLPPAGDAAGTHQSYEIFLLFRRGKQHVHAGRVMARTPLEAMHEANKQFAPAQVVYNVWAIRTDDIRFTKPEEKELWLTLPEKKFRDASDYKAGDKLKEFLERFQSAKS